jgi:ATP-binding cassette subfamily C protein
VIIMAHRPSAIAACDYLLMIDKGTQIEFGPRDEVLKKRTRNYPQLVARQQGPEAGGAAGAAGDVRALPHGQAPALAAGGDS